MSVVVPFCIESLYVTVLPSLINNCLVTILAKGMGSKVCWSLSVRVCPSI